MAKQHMFVGDLFIVYDNEKYRVTSYVNSARTKYIDREYERTCLKMASVLLFLKKLGV